MRDEFNIAVIEGDIASSVDSEKIKAQGIAAVQINTGGACHLESDMIRRAVDVLDLDKLDLIIIENVGNLVCPTDFDLGENMKAMILSVPEGDDKPLKYPGVFQAASAIVLNKVDTIALCLPVDQGPVLQPYCQPEPPGSHFPHFRHERPMAWKSGPTGWLKRSALCKPCLPSFVRWV